MMADVLTTRSHDKDMLVAGFKHDLAKAQAEIERLRAALWPFAMHHQIKAGYCADDFRRASEAMGELPIAVDEQKANTEGD